MRFVLSSSRGVVVWGGVGAFFLFLLVFVRAWLLLEIVRFSVCAVWVVGFLASGAGAF